MHRLSILIKIASGKRIATPGSRNRAGRPETVADKIRHPSNTTALATPRKSRVHDRLSRSSRAILGNKTRSTHPFQAVVERPGKQTQTQEP